MKKVKETFKKFLNVVSTYFKKRNTINPNDKADLKDCKTMKVNVKKLNRALWITVSAYIVLITAIVILTICLINVNLRLQENATAVAEHEAVVEELTRQLIEKDEYINQSNLDAAETQKQLEEKDKEIKEKDEKIKELESKVSSYNATQTSVARGSLSSRDGSTQVRQVSPTNASSSDRELLARIINAEAGGSSVEDQMLVGNVVLNRVNSEKFPDTIREVIYQRGQYSPTWNGAINKIPTETAYACADRLLAGERLAPSNVVFQAQFKQGSGVWKKVGNHYYCYA